jgi:hypothetical protein
MPASGTPGCTAATRRDGDSYTPAPLSTRPRLLHGWTRSIICPIAPQKPLRIPLLGPAAVDSVAPAPTVPLPDRRRYVGHPDHRPNDWHRYLSHEEVPAERNGGGPATTCRIRPAWRRSPRFRSGSSNSCRSTIWAVMATHGRPRFMTSRGAWACATSSSGSRLASVVSGERAGAGARRSDDTDARSGIASGPLAADLSYRRT